MLNLRWPLWPHRVNTCYAQLMEIILNPLAHNIPRKCSLLATFKSLNPWMPRLPQGMSRFVLSRFVLQTLSLLLHYCILWFFPCSMRVLRPFRLKPKTKHSADIFRSALGTRTCRLCRQFKAPPACGQPGQQDMHTCAPAQIIVCVSVCVYRCVHLALT